VTRLTYFIRSIRDEPMKRRPVLRRIDGDRRDPEFTSSTRRPNRDLAPIGDEKRSHEFTLAIHQAHTEPGKMTVMTVHPRAGQPATEDDLIDPAALVTAYYTQHPDPHDPGQRVSFGTSGHRGSALDSAFNDDHIAATTQAICEFRKAAGIRGPLFLGRDSHALSRPAWATALEVLAAHSVTVLIDNPDALTPTPAVSHAIVRHNFGRRADDPGRADGIVITPSHNPPRDGGFKYNPPDGGPAGSDITTTIQERANELLGLRLEGVRRVILTSALAASTTQRYDFLGTYVDDLPSVVDLDAIRDAGVRIGADPLGGASVAYWEAIAERHRLNLTVVNPRIDPTWRFMTLDWDGQIRMDCSSPHAMASLIGARHDFDIATGNDADSDRHGIVTPDAGLMNPNHFLAVAIDYLFSRRDGWWEEAAVGKTMVSSSMIDRVTAHLGRTLWEVPVGFKWFVPGLIDGRIGFGGEESAGASFLRRDGQPWTTDKDGIILALLASEILATTGASPSAHYRRLTERFGDPAYARIDAPANREAKAALAALTSDQVTAHELAGEPIETVLTHAPGNGAALGGVKVVAASSWFAARPSGTEDVYKIYAESFLGAEHLAEVQQAARTVVDAALGSSDGGAA
jgi:phosphoglucomutase